MEICVKMDTSQYYSGINSSTNETDLTEFYCQQENQLQQQVNINEQDNLPTQNSGYQNLNSQWDQTVECKQEIDTFANYSDDNKNDNSNNNNTDYYQGDNPNEIEDFKEPLQYSFGTTSQIYPNYNRTQPYQITSTGAPLPTWYHPPNITCTSQPQPAPNPQYQQMGMYSNLQNSNTPFPQYQQQYQNTPYLPLPTTTSPSTAVPSIPPEHMMNMIHLTNRYDYDNAKAVNKILNGREARNRAEKNRRDKLNGSIQELSSMVPHVAESPRRVDKTAVLRFSAHGLRIDYVFGKTNSNRFLVKPSQTEGLMRLLDTFLLSLTCRGQIVLVSPAVEQYLGHCQTDLFGQSILNITHPDDHAFLKQQLIPTDLHNLFLHKTDENGEPRSRTPEEEAEIDRKLREDRRDFTVRLARAGPRSEPTTYELVRIDGCFRRADQAPRGKPNTGPTGLQLIRRARGRDDNIPLHSISGNDIILIAMARVMKPPNICDRLIEACKYEYKTRHLIDGRIVQCDQRISIVAGYLTEEVSGLSPFTFMHKDDVRWVMVALRQMYDLNRPYGESCYRLISRTGQFIYLKTRGYLEVDEGNHQVHSFVCINTLVPEDEGRRLVKEMKKKFSVIVSQQELDAMESDIPAVENPQQLEKAILNLITNLDNARDDDNMSIISNSTNDNEDSRSTKSPPLSIIPPKPSTIKLSIDKSVNVIVSTIRKDIIKKEPQSPTSMNNSRPSVLQKNYSSVPEKTNLLSPSNEALKQRSNSESSYKNYSSPSCNDQLNIKVEPNIMSPTSSLSSVDSEYMVVNQNATTTLNTSETDDFSTPFDNIPIYDPQYIDTSLMATPAKQPRMDSNETISSYSKTDSIIKTTNKTVLNKNNNTSNINRNTVLKRAHSEETNSNEGFKKRSLVENNDSCSSLITAVECGTGLDISPSAFEAIDRSLSELEGGTQYNQFGMSPNNLDNLEDDIMSNQPESEDVLQTLQEDYHGDVDYNEGNNNKKYNNGRS